MTLCTELTEFVSLLDLYMFQHSPETVRSGLKRTAPSVTLGNLKLSRILPLTTSDRIGHLGCKLKLGHYILYSMTTGPHSS